MDSHNAVQSFVQLMNVENVNGLYSGNHVYTISEQYNYITVYNLQNLYTVAVYVNGAQMYTFSSAFVGSLPLAAMRKGGVNNNVQLIWYESAQNFTPPDTPPSLTVVFSAENISGGAFDPSSLITAMNQLGITMKSVDNRQENLYNFQILSSNMYSPDTSPLCHVYTLGLTIPAGTILPFAGSVRSASGNIQLPADAVLAPSGMLSCVVNYPGAMTPWSIVINDLTSGDAITLNSGNALPTPITNYSTGKITVAKLLQHLNDKFQAAVTTKLSDFLTWTTGSIATSYTWTSIAYGNGVYVATNTAGSIATSPDGVTWTFHATPYPTSWGAVTFGAGVFVAFATAGYGSCISSPDGITWTLRSLGTSYPVIGSCYGNGKFIAVAEVAGYSWTSPDGITWTGRSNMGATAAWSCVAYGNGVYVALASGYSNAAVSSDGITWTLKSIGSATWTSIAYGNGAFVAVPDTLTRTGAISKDGGNTWSPITFPSAPTWINVCFGNGYFMVCARSSPTVYYSADGVTWTATAIAASATTACMGYGNGMFLVMSDGTTYRTPCACLLSDATFALTLYVDFYEPL